jgi:hypothetical protein
MSGGLLIVEKRQDWSFILFACGIAVLIASTLIEPVTERGAFEPADVQNV